MLSGCGKSDKSSETASTDQAASTTATTTDSKADVVEVKVSAKDWEYDQKEIHVKKGDKVRITLTSDDGGHGLSLPVYNVDIQGNDSAEFTADQVGQFEFRCSVPCGQGHMEMKGTLIVDA
ncbi:hypothetical protein PCCS19_09200 [Paenibacillus sp. CCS19]|uniref:cupredoxin domain-containing protein n=1 Tax=Paenibacillus sp. CCS19 TaxID=3158387 RepID=UPI00256AA917|nr:cupredoxin domain-containing protein [Paenibacillus cellulosilyticus]GMK37866.1 hypothetical protein PCCS19_09200 [Paenibacillus cellulosilyticus]